MSGMREAKLQKAIAYILAHPDASKSEAVLATKTSDGTIAKARKLLVERGLISQARNADPVLPPLVDMLGPDAPSTQAGQDQGATAGGEMLDHAALTAMADMHARLEAEDLPDAEVQRRLMRQAQLFAFNPTLHPDTRMSASTLWAKLRDMKKDESIGPGVPMTFRVAVDRTKEVLIAVGMAVAAVAVQEAFYSEAPNAGSESRTESGTGPGLVLQEQAPSEAKRSTVAIGEPRPAEGSPAALAMGPEPGAVPEAG